MAKNQTQNSKPVSVSPSQSVNEPKKPRYSLEKSPFSKKQLAIFALVFALIGGVALWRAFAAAPLLASVEAENMVLGASSEPPTACSTSTNAWQNNSFTSQTGSFTAKYSIIPSANGIDALTGFSNGPASDYTNLAAIVRFNPNGLIDARNGADYGATTTLNYSAGQTYNVRMVINATNHTYSVYVTPSGGSEVTIANNFAFRTEQATLSQLSNWALIYDSGGSHQVCDMQITATSTPAPTPSPAPSPTPSPTPAPTPSPGAQSLSIQAEDMIYSPSTTFPITDASASGGKALELYKNGSINSSFNLTSSASSVTVTAKSSTCSSVYAYMTLRVDGKRVLARYVNSLSWSGYIAKVNLTAGSHSLRASFTNDAYQENVCDRNLFVDKVVIGQTLAAVSETPTTLAATTTAFAQVENDPNASNGKDVSIYANGAITGQFYTPTQASSVSVTAKSIVCDGTWANMIVSIDGRQVFSGAVNSSTWKVVSAAGTFAAGNHTLSIAFDNDVSANGCDRNLYIDKTDIFGAESSPPPNASPTVTLSASPTSVSAGSPSTLTWNSTNATTCTASGSWSGTKNTSGSSTTGALNQSSTYSLSCSGAGGTASASATVTVAAATPPPSGTGTVRHAGPGQVLSAIAASSPGDTVIVDAGNHPQLVLNKSFAAPGVTILGSAGAVFAGIDTNGQSGYNFNAITSILPAEVNNYDITTFYLHGGSERINLTGAFKLQGGYDGIKVYGGSKDCTIDDGGAASSISGYGGDGIHVNQSTNLWIKSVNIYNPYDLTATPEHNDGIHAQDFNNLRIGGGSAGGIVHITGLVTANSPRSDVDSGGMFLRGEPSASQLTIDGVEIHWQIGRGMQIIDIGGATTIRKLSITDSGIIGESPAITFDGSYNVDVYGPLTGFSKSDCYIVGSGSATWH